MATDSLLQWLRGLSRKMQEYWPDGETDQSACKTHLMVPRERMGVKSPLNTGIFCSHQICSEPCLREAMAVHKRSKIRGLKVNDQNALVALWRNKSCRIHQIDSSIQEYESTGVFTGLMSLFNLWVPPPAFNHYTRAEERACFSRVGKSNPKRSGGGCVGSYSRLRAHR